MLNPDLSYYGFQLIKMETQRDDFSPEMIATSLTLKRTHTASTTETKSSAESLLADMEVMNKVRNSLNPAVKEAYEQLLTVMALTNVRNDDS